MGSVKSPLQATGWIKTAIKITGRHGANS